MRDHEIENIVLGDGMIVFEETGTDPAYMPAYRLGRDATGKIKGVVFQGNVYKDQIVQTCLVKLVRTGKRTVVRHHIGLVTGGSPDSVWTLQRVMWVVGIECNFPGVIAVYSFRKDGSVYSWINYCIV